MAKINYFNERVIAYYKGQEIGICLNLTSFADLRLQICNEVLKGISSFKDYTFKYKEHNIHLSSKGEIMGISPEDHFIDIIDKIIDTKYNINK